MKIQIAFKLIVLLHAFTAQATGLQCLIETESRIIVSNIGESNAVDSFLQNANLGTLKDRIRSVIAIGRRRKFSDDAFVKYTKDSIAYSRNNVFSRMEPGEPGIQGSTKSLGSEFHITIDAIFDPSVMEVATAIRNSKFSTTLPKVMYAVIEGAALNTAVNKNIRKVKIVAGKVVNPMLQEMFTEMGFVYEKTGIPLTQAELRSQEMRTLVFEIDLK